MRLFLSVVFFSVTMVKAQLPPGVGQQPIPGQPFEAPGIPGQYPSYPGMGQPGLPAGPGAVPRGWRFCAPGEPPYNPAMQMCCNYEVVPMLGPAKFAQCCDGEVMDNRTELCCANRDRVTRYEQGCCGIDGYDLHGEACCANRHIYEPDWQMCCGRSVMPRFGHVCCDGRATTIPMMQNPADFVCCGRRSMDRTTHTCCGGKAIRKSSSSKCCSGKVYRKGKQSCCQDKSGDMKIHRGSSCSPEKPKATKPPTKPEPHPPKPRQRTSGVTSPPRIPSRPPVLGGPAREKLATPKPGTIILEPKTEAPLTREPGAVTNSQQSNGGNLPATDQASQTTSPPMPTGTISIPAHFFWRFWPQLGAMFPYMR